MSSIRSDGKFEIIVKLSAEPVSGDFLSNESVLDDSTSHITKVLGIGGELPVAIDVAISRHEEVFSLLALFAAFRGTVVGAELAVFVSIVSGVCSTRLKVG